MSYTKTKDHHAAICIWRRKGMESVWVKPNNAPRYVGCNNYYLRCFVNDHLVLLPGNVFFFFSVNIHSNDSITHMNLKSQRVVSKREPHPCPTRRNSLKRSRRLHVSGYAVPPCRWVVRHSRQPRRPISQCGEARRAGPQRRAGGIGR